MNKSKFELKIYELATEIPEGKGKKEHGYTLAAFGTFDDGHQEFLGQVKLSDCHSKDCWWLSHLFVRAYYRGQGVARALMEQAFDTGLGRTQSISLNVSNELTIRAWYEKLGFIPACEYDDGKIMLTYNYNQVEASRCEK